MILPDQQSKTQKQSVSMRFLQKLTDKQNPEKVLRIVSQ